MMKLYARKITLSLLCATLTLAAMADGIGASGFHFATFQKGLTDTLSTFSKNVLSDRKPKTGLKTTPLTFSISKFLYNTKTVTPPTSGNSRSIMFADNDDQRSVFDVKVFQGPINDGLTISYNLKKENTVTIKLMDLLGNEVLTLMPQQHIGAGLKETTYNLSNSLSKGYYFIRVIVGGESITKRISIL
ncbi:T9SS type A sorting domain-containing protein [Solitalea koreensis]|uniref:Por secretion system C-terminal sorting domain-containing protein n=1 Tax=Solitalea koreensis TaxID=543615 RepID=A0A521D036_9SPHI|nr:T9SS type A sorting domain-containing protein [Solitalea koreensis]SMO65044.1 Por secretion system C-terminal sorting domain-containing protein [Solitalea koreensis]